MTLKNIHFSALILLLSLVTSCTNEVDTTLVQADSQKEKSEVQDSITAEETPEEVIWGLYEGYLGIYEKHIVMELNISGDQVSGKYFYTKHQKSLDLKGNFNEATNVMSLTESYKGKVTGYLEFKLSRGIIEGKWMKKKGATESESFKASLINLNKNEFNLTQNRYEDEHTVLIYNGVDGEDEMEATDVLTINRIGKKYFSFYYSVVGGNAHLGSIEGFGTLDKAGNGLFKDEEACELKFTFSNNKAEVEETGDCQYYRGARAYFMGTLKKVN